MQRSLFATAVLASLAASVYAADPLTIDTPASLKQCMTRERRLTRSILRSIDLPSGPQKATDGEGNIVAITGINGIWDRYISWYGTIRAGTTVKFTVVDADLFLAETAHRTRPRWLLGIFLVMLLSNNA